ncbi:Gryzun, putative trafficking through golgi-domain-containing protein [Cantharellus anzutake]|uniref:Gryzun, putative trafficking through golgi-domain-containing protein n=1 Tax=Cantharellus anzutake TaxID=1750568 RepID=UPI001906435A|nr:Gryzun, putative trafficking through golgi-domain-containing protein [Cantharellus anzutake]KAF8331398.1 Gryzun, putative trafficking through golgi-domain-containing protein [Cantharellus anzutake]
MNSYPIELIVQYAPVMFVAGLTESQPSEGASGAPSSPKTLSETIALTPDSKDPFSALIERLRSVLSAKRRAPVWDSDRTPKFQVALVDRAVRFPPRKINPPQQSVRNDDIPSTSVPHSPLSPLIPSSPLYPDGLIAPVWVRKHLELVPSVFVLFLRLWEPPPPSSPLDTGNSQDREEERKQDADLSAEIAVRKRSTGERGIKLTVVLLASRRMLEDPSLDARLSFIRRQSGLDSRAALFVLSPLNTTELQEFVQSLQDALFESATDYYTAHTKRVRRKKSRPAHIPASSGPTIGRPLRNEGWIVRYEYKMATFAEFRMEDELARKHYEDCWEGLIGMFTSTTVLPPKTKRWAEAKVLADTVSLKICKLYLYHSEFNRALMHFNRHLMRFSEMMSGWGIGEDSFEYWSWVARQYRAFAELLDQASRSGLQPTSNSASKFPGAVPQHLSTPSVSTVDPSPAFFGLNPLNALQHTGYFYYAAAACTRRRLERFTAINNQDVHIYNTRCQSPTYSPALVNERKVDHLGTLTELYSKAYELFKFHGGSSSRLTYHMAYRIAETHFLSKRYDLAAKFFERIERTYEEERWGDMPEPLLAMWCECSRKLGSRGLTIRLLLTILSERRSAGKELRGLLEVRNMSTYKSVNTRYQLRQMPSPPEDHNFIELESPLALFHMSSVFWRGTVYVGEPASFQLTLTSPETNIEFLFTELRIYYSEHLPPVIVQHPEIGIETPYTFLGDFDVSSIDNASAVPIQADLHWVPGKSKTFAGYLTSSVTTELRIHKVELLFDKDTCKFMVPIKLIGDTDQLPRTVQWFAPASSVGPQLSVSRSRPDSCSVVFRPHLFSISYGHEEPAYCNELYPINIEITNEHDQDLEFDLDVLLQPSDDDTVSYVMVGEERSQALIKGVSFGIVQKGTSATRILYFIGGASGERTLDISIQSRALCTDGEPDQAIHMNETLRQLKVLVVPPIQCAFRTAYLRDSRPLLPVMDLSKFEPNAFEPVGRALVSIDVTCTGPQGIVVSSIQLIPRASSGFPFESDGPRARVLYTSLDFGERDFPSVWQSNDAFSIMCEVELGEDDAEEFPNDEVPFPGSFEVTWQKISSTASNLTAKTNISPPSLKPPEDSIVALITCPPSANLHQPFILTLSVQNRQRFRTADLYLDVDSSEAFVLAGPRHTRLPTLLPGMSEEVFFNLIPLSTGEVRLPTFKVHDRRKPPGLLPPENEDEQTDAPYNHASLSRVPVLLASQDARFEEPEQAEGARVDPDALPMIVYP